MANKLKIYACSGIGIGRTETSFDYWTDNTNTANNTQAVNTMLANINLAYAEVQNLNLSDKEALDKLNQIDLYTLALCCADSYSGQPDMLLRCGHVVGKMYADGKFLNNSFDNANRDGYLNELIGFANDYLNNDDDSIRASDEFMQWWDENIMQRDKVGLTEEQRGKIKKALKRVSGVGASYTDNAELSKMLDNGADYFIYTYLSDEQINSIQDATRRRTFILKKRNQQQTYDFCKGLYTKMYGSEKKMQDVIRSGIIKSFKCTPEELAQSIAEGVKGVGVLGIDDIIYIITAVGSILITIVTAICECVLKSNEAKYKSLDKSIITGGTPEASDYPGGMPTPQKKSWIWIAAAGVAAFLFLKK